MATGKLADEVSGPACNRLNEEEGQVTANNLKPKSTWTRINRMDFGLGGLSKALLLPTHGKRSIKSNLEEAA